MRAEAGEALHQKDREDPDQPGEAEGGGRVAERDVDAVLKAAGGIRVHRRAPLRSMRISISRAAASTKKVMTNKMRPSSISDAV